MVGQESESKRLRVRRACTYCRFRRIKCDGEQPCSHCRRRAQLCEYSTEIGSNLPKKSHLNHNFGPRKPTQDEYIRYLENRVQNLENSLMNKFPTNAQSSNKTIESNILSLDGKRTGRVTRHDAILANKLGQYLFFKLHPSERESLSIPRLQFYGWNMSGGHYLNQMPLAVQPLILNPSKQSDLCAWLLNFFFHKVNPLFCMIHQPVFMDQYHKYVNDLIIAADTKAAKLFNAILYLIFAIAIRFSENHPQRPNRISVELKPGMEEDLFHSAYETVSKLSFEWQSLELIQSWVLITFYLRAAHRQTSSYTSLGSAIRMCKGMLLNIEINNNANRDQAYEEIKAKRMFWLVYTWDRLYSWQSGRQCEIQDESINREFPPLDGTSCSDGWLQKPALSMIYLGRYSGRLQQHAFGNKNVDETFLKNIAAELSQVKSWCDSNMSCDEFDRLLLDQVYLTYHDIYLSLYNKQLLGLIDCHSCVEWCYSDAFLLKDQSQQTLDIFENMRSRAELEVPWWMNLSLMFNISLISVILIYSGIETEEFADTFRRAISLLNAVKGKASMSTECVWAIKTLNHMCFLRMQKTANSLAQIGIDHGPSTVNQHRFLEFDHVGRGPSDQIIASSPTGSLSGIKSSSMLDNEIDANECLNWFDPWLEEVF
ncbi:hypothetical protein KL906_005435 [Ogataea polymorpha]|nr:hypothetical protein KL906_005435 [Ogataea polymorpha]KAG7925881.1 hypothetical protein KL934_005414 [Ogataea polymorpha]